MTLLLLAPVLQTYRWWCYRSCIYSAIKISPTVHNVFAHVEFPHPKGNPLSFLCVQCINCEMAAELQSVGIGNYRLWETFLPSRWAADWLIKASDWVIVRLRATLQGGVCNHSVISCSFMPSTSRFTQIRTKGVNNSCSAENWYNDYTQK